MPATYAIDLRKNVALVTLSGHLTGDELAETYQAYLEDIDWQPTFHILWDARQLEDFDIGPHNASQLLRVMTSLRHRVGPGYSAMIVRARHRDKATSFSQTFGLLSGRHPGRIQKAFLSLREAADWLGLSGADLPGLPPDDQINEA